jgi:hypothetical protein
MIHVRDYYLALVDIVINILEGQEFIYVLSKYQVVKKDSFPRSCVRQMNIRVVYLFVTTSVFIDNLFGSSLSKFFEKGRRLFVGFPPRRSGFSSKSGQVGFMVDKVTLGWLPPYTFISSANSYSTNSATFFKHSFIRLYIFSVLIK